MTDNVKFEENHATDNVKFEKHCATDNDNW